MIKRVRLRVGGAANLEIVLPYTCHSASKKKAWSDMNSLVTSLAWIGATFSMSKFKIEALGPPYLL